MENILTFNLVLNKLIIFQGLVWITQFSTGYFLVTKWNVKVNYTRKINHFVMVFAPIFIDWFFPYEKNFLRVNFMYGYALLFLLIYWKPIRERFRFIQIMFRSLDRPEDRPYTLTWLWLQFFFTYLMIDLMIIFLPDHRTGLIIMLIGIIVGFGDGLAEPVGIRFGKHKYKTRALFTKKRYERSLEGSACVLIVGLIAVPIIFSGMEISGVYFWLGIMIIPIVMTLTEAFSPHTWDSPFLVLVGYPLIYTIVNLNEWIDKLMT